jgi:hypothetical protein
VSGPERTSPLLTERSGRRRLAGVGVAAALAFIGGLMLLTHRSEGTDSTPSRSSKSAPVPGPAEPEAVASREGAIAAAVSYAGASQRWLYLPDDQVAAAVEQIAAPASARRLADSVVADVRAARKRLGASPGAVWWLVRPLAYRVDRESPAAVTVSVWTVAVLSAEQVAVPQSEWVTVTIDLEWSAGWRVAAVADRPGPTPATGPRDRPWDAVPFASALSGFTRLGEEVAG